MSEKAERLSVSHITATKTTGASINRLSASHCPPKEGDRPSTGKSAEHGRIAEELPGARACLWWGAGCRGHLLSLGAHELQCAGVQCMSYQYSGAGV